MTKKTLRRSAKVEDRKATPKARKRKPSQGGIEEQEKKKARAHGSFDTEWWLNREVVEATKERESAEKREAACTSSQLSEQQFLQTPPGKKIFAEELAARERRQHCAERAKLPADDPNSPKPHMRKSFMKLHTTSKMGLGIMTTGAGPRNSAEQRQFRADLIKAHGAKVGKELWCPILGQFFPHDEIVAGHLFPYGHSKANMDGIFGKDASLDMFSARNGILLHENIEAVFDIGKLALIPHIPGKPDWTSEAIHEWLSSEPREYQVKILDPKWTSLKKSVIDGSTLTFGDLDGRQLQFRTPFRPAARYVYYHFCEQVLRSAWPHNETRSPAEAAEVLEKEYGKPYWGTPGKYVTENMLLAFVEEIGHNPKPLLNDDDSPLESADLSTPPGEDDDEEDDDDNDSPLRSAAQRVKGRNRRAAPPSILDVEMRPQKVAEAPDSEPGK
ncbi:hypothetical protein N7539_003241 [Penicillium diatomitis]|uniref:HNH nuclease domain-containing protein n=1 Tax=Penicillium diatomitis TaxID=2819901 RepID=A0A9W9XGA6_9EURO|nr:uncharacterized protein N7539_003241 [Penicillium diatomitis]KAJ5491674.1 hypothetical protein N7539_003241 [Penicillium diatomitis]